MRSKAPILVALALMAVSTTTAVSQARTLGYSRVTVPANSDAYVSIPFAGPCVGPFTVDTVVPSTGVTVAGDPFTANQYDSVYYVRFTSGAAAGKWSTITLTAPGQLNLALAALTDGVATEADVAPGDTFVVCKHLTLATAFPDGLENLSFKASITPSNRSTEILLPSTGTGINKAPTSLFFFLSSAKEWRQQGAAGNKDNTVLAPGSYFIIRNRNNAEALTFYGLGEVEAQVTLRVNLEAVQNDVPVSANNPVGVALKDLGLANTAAFETSTSLTAPGRRDQLLVWDNSSTGINKAPVGIYFYTTGGWRKQGSGATSFDDFVIEPGQPMLLRKVTSAVAGDPVGVYDWARTNLQ